MKKIIVALFGLFFANSLFFAQTSKTFTYKYQKDDRYRILSRVEEDIFINNQLNHKSEIIGRVTVHTTDVTANGWGKQEATFMTTENSNVATPNLTNSAVSTLVWNEEYNSVYEKSPLGRFNIDRSYFMPVIRDMPIFPDKEIAPGDTWSDTGYEAHDLRRGFNLQEPVLIPFEAFYTYLGEEKSESGKTFDVFKVTYNLYFDSPTPENQNELHSDYPMTTTGYSQQTLYWDYEKGTLDHYTETFRITIISSFGTVYKFTGNTKAEITQFERTTQDLDKIQQRVQNLSIENVQVTNNEKGLTISLENIQFKADSSVLEDSEKDKIKKLAQILKEYPNNDLLISGHTALAGTADSRLELSKERAASVANYLVELGVKDLYHIFTQGFGSEKPIAPNTTDEGRSKNRRVEITILDK